MLPVTLSKLCRTYGHKRAKSQLRILSTTTMPIDKLQSLEQILITCLFDFTSSGIRNFLREADLYTETTRPLNG